MSFRKVLMSLLTKNRIGVDPRKVLIDLDLLVYIHDLDPFLRQRLLWMTCAAAFNFRGAHVNAMR